MTVSAEARAVIWSAWPTADDDPFPAGVRVARYISLVREHKLSSTAIRKLSTDACVPDAVMLALKRLDEESVAHDRAIRSDVRSLGSDLMAYTRHHGAVLYLKGHSSQIHTNGRFRDHRPTTDIDLLAREPNELHDALVRLGYVAGKPGISHELSSLHREGHVDIDLQRYFPAWSYPQRSARHNEHVSASARIRTMKLSYATLLETSVPHPDDEAGSFRVPGPEATALVIALHAFKDYVEASFTHGERKVTLLEVLEFGELLRLPVFDMRLFNALSASVDGHDAVTFIRSLLSELQGQTADARGAASPRELGRGFLYTADESLSSLVQMRSFYSGLIAERPTDTWPTLDGERGSSSFAPSAMTCRPAWYTRDVSHDVSVRRSAGTVTLCVAAPVPRHELHYFIHVILGLADRYEKVSLDLANHTLLRTENGVARSMTIEADRRGWRASFELDESEVSGEPVVIHSYLFVRPLNDDWNHLYDDALVSTAIPIRFPGQARAREGQ